MDVQQSIRIIMARHLMAVCVVCLLCAEHLPCKHVDDNTMSAKKLLENDDSRLVNQNYMDISYLTDDNSYNTLLEQTVPNKRKGRTKNPNEQVASDKEPSLQKLNKRDKRHAVHTNSDDEPDVHRITQMYVRKIFEGFADGDKMTMNVIELENMLKKLNLSIVDQNEFLSESQAIASVPNEELNDTVSLINSSRFLFSNVLPYFLLQLFQCISSIDFVTRISSEHHQEIKSTKLNGDSSQSLMANQTDSMQSTKENLFLNSKDFLAICPILVYYATAATSLERSVCIGNSLVPVNLHDHDVDHMEAEDRTLG